jgi:type II secretory pathway pseudopilin PulG
MTLLELTVVILVMLSLVAILFIGAQSWKRGSDRTLCIMNLQNVQKGVRGYMNVYGYKPGETVSDLKSKVIGLGRFVEAEPSCPRDGAYTYVGDQFPAVGVLYMTCSLAESENHQPQNHIDW